MEPPSNLYPPEIMDGYDLWVEDFWELSTTRAVFDGGCGPISALSIKAFAEKYPGEEKLFSTVMRQMDSIFLQDAAKHRKALADGKPVRKQPTKILSMGKI